MKSNSQCESATVSLSSQDHPRFAMMNATRKFFYQLANRTNLRPTSFAFLTSAVVVASLLLVSSTMVPQFDDASAKPASAEFETASVATQPFKTQDSDFSKYQNRRSITAGEAVMKLSAASSSIWLICDAAGGRTTCFLTETFDGEGQRWHPPCNTYDNRYKCVFSCNRTDVRDIVVSHEGVTYSDSVCGE